MNIIIGLIVSLILGYWVSSIKEIAIQSTALLIIIIILFISYYKQIGWFKWKQQKLFLVIFIIFLFVGYLIGEMGILGSINKLTIGTIIVIFMILFIGHMGISNLLKDLKYKIYNTTTAGFGYLYGIMFLMMWGVLFFGFIVSKEFEPLILSLVLFVIGFTMIYLSRKIQKKSKKVKKKR